MSCPNLLRPMAMLSTCLFLASASNAQDPTSGTFLLDTELYRGLDAAFGDVLIEEDGVGGLHVSVLLDPEVAGEHARVHRVYLSMTEWPEGLEVVPDDPDAMRMSVRPQDHAWLTMGADFGTMVSIKPRSDHHRHRGHRWHPWHRSHRSHEPMQEVGFTLLADKPLPLASALGMTATRRDDVVQIGVDVHGLDVGRRHSAPGLLAGLFEADAPPVDDEEPIPGDDEEPTPDDGEGPGPGDGEVPLPDDGVIPPGCFGVIYPVTNRVTSLFCP